MPLTEDREAIARQLLDDGRALDWRSAVDLACNPKNFPPDEDVGDGTF